MPRLGRYVLVGGLAAFVDLFGFVALRALGAGVVPAAAISFFVAMVANYALSVVFAFEGRAGVKSFALFAVLAAVGFSINVGVTAAAALAFGVWPPMAKVFGIAVAFTFNFAANHLVVFPAPQAPANKGDRPR